MYETQIRGSRKTIVIWMNSTDRLQQIAWKRAKLQKVRGNRSRMTVSLLRKIVSMRSKVSSHWLSKPKIFMAPPKKHVKDQQYNTLFNSNCSTGTPLHRVTPYMLKKQIIALKLEQTPLAQAWTIIKTYIKKRKNKSCHQTVTERLARQAVKKLRVCWKLCMPARITKGS